MMKIRHANVTDIDSIYQLALKAGIGMSSLPHNKDVIKERLQRMEDTVAGKAEKADAGYLFVLEDTSTGQIAGISGIEVAVGLKEPFYSFRIAKQVHSSKILNVYKSYDTLVLSNDYTNTSELCSLFLDPDYRKDQNGKFLSRVRFMFIAAFQLYFQEKLIAEMRGVSDEKGNSPFWNGFGSHFFDIEFSQADYLAGTGHKIFIAELMPRSPVYVDFLSQEAREVIGVCHPHTLPAAKLLMAEGLKYQGFVDIFDGGPSLECEISNLRAVNDSQVCQVLIADNSDNDNKPDTPLTSYLVANDDYHNYSAMLLDERIFAQPFNNLPHQHNPHTVTLTPKQAEILGVSENDQVRILPLDGTKA